ncbi:hypothetical protein Hanom_Chr13g01216231 [Helianthus anomalus]
MITSLERPFITNICQLGVRMQLCDEELVESAHENAKIKKRRTIAKKLAIVILFGAMECYSQFI